MKKQTFKIALLSIVTLFTLAGCASSGTDIVTMKGGKITSEDLYEKLKEDPNTGSLVSQMIIQQVANNGYASKVDQKEVDKMFKETEEQYGGKDQLEQQLKMNGLTVKGYKQQITDYLATQEMMKAHLDLTEDDYKETFKTFNPEVEAQIILVEEKKDADAILKDLKDNKADFSKLAKDKTIDNVLKETDGKVKFSSQPGSTPEGARISQEIKDAAFKLKDNELSGVIAVTDPNTGQPMYAIVKMLKAADKGTDYKKFEKEIKEITEANKLADQTFQLDVIGKELDKAKVEIKEPAFKDALAPYLPQKEETVESSTQESKAKEEKSDSKK